MEYRLTNGKLEYVVEGSHALPAGQGYLHTWNLSPAPVAGDTLVAGRAYYKIVREEESRHSKFPATFVVIPLPAIPNKITE